jgi:hypothetical protein
MNKYQKLIARMTHKEMGYKMNQYFWNNFFITKKEIKSCCRFQTERKEVKKTIKRRDYEICRAFRISGE